MPTPELRATDVLGVALVILLVGWLSSWLAYKLFGGIGENGKESTLQSGYCHYFGTRGYGIYSNTRL